ncbi:uncharacterized protein PV07_10071 [Cladophialophora immunda]|uniref:Transcription factor Iwr1 domain-containing protein n=1 Tax=Cladophialophora immunda TaxID=569365 RepID=A0A0D2AHH7_9EURO|nr:uncharacterized protein PV07_10071 [Cladophialophora immunda]KIW24352.1 hypothetical protein PV07_10071 [Cladophialophora immunda]OQU97917.1 hypothetical protein CLAIMM_03776 isoform 1 [Cladophialophora immunda]OQU97918.1 hypothetical protein CLAIMM_03776 isoform 2 [Cladophialophora immunda]
MSLPPERISVKRRRQEEPVEALYLEHGTGPDKKRRVTDFYFQRLQNDVIAPVSQRATSQAIWSEPPAPGVPPIRLTSPDDAKRDLEEPGTEKDDAAPKEKSKAPDNASADSASKSAPTTPAASQALQQARRFHLTRHLSSVLSPSTSGGIRKPKNFIRPPLATFVERHAPVFSHEQNPLYRDQPIDKMLDVRQDNGVGGSKSDEVPEPNLEALQASRRSQTSTFVQTASGAARNGTSIRDHPSTWNLESDQLADELAALAMELDPDMQQPTEAVLPTPPPSKPQDIVMTSHDREDDYVYETYVRVQYVAQVHGPDTATGLHSNYGILVIDEEDEDLWQKYIDSDDDTDWDEEDSNAEDNPANDYPEEEVSSDDEYGYNPYKYRTYGSDQEDFDNDHTFR